MEASQGSEATIASPPTAVPPGGPDLNASGSPPVIPVSHDGKPDRCPALVKGGFVVLAVCLIVATLFGFSSQRRADDLAALLAASRSDLALTTAELSTTRVELMERDLEIAFLQSDNGQLDAQLQDEQLLHDACLQRLRSVEDELEYVLAELY